MTGKIQHAGFHMLRPYFEALAFGSSSRTMVVGEATPDLSPIERHMVKWKDDKSSHYPSLQLYD